MRKLETMRQELIEKIQKTYTPEKILINKKQKSLFLQMRSQRGSQYRGVSRNGLKWQVMIVKGDLRKYIGAIQTQEQAARYYDKYSIIMQGLQVS